MRVSRPCRMFGAQQALGGMEGGVLLLHSTVGCHYASLGFHFISTDMAEVRQTCTVIGEDDIVMGGTRSLKKSLETIKEQYDPSVVFLLQGCVSDIIQDDIHSECRDLSRSSGIRVLPVECSGFGGSEQDGYEAALTLLIELMEDHDHADNDRKKIGVNLLGFGQDTPGAEADIRELKYLLAPDVEIVCVPGISNYDRLKYAGGADLNIVLGRGKKLAIEMERKFGIPWVSVDHPFGLVGIRKIWDLLHSRFSLSFEQQELRFIHDSEKRLRRVYSYLQSLYGVPCAVIGTEARCAGLASFLSNELGMEIEFCGCREEYDSAEKIEDALFKHEIGMIFGSSFETEFAEKLGIPLVRCEYPIFDRMHLREHPYIGVEGTVSILEDMINEVHIARHLNGELFL